MRTRLEDIWFRHPLMDPRDKAFIIKMSKQLTAARNDLLREGMERDALKAECEKLRGEYTKAETTFEDLIQEYREGRDKARAQLAEAVSVIRDSACLCNIAGDCRRCDFLAKAKI